MFDIEFQITFTWDIGFLNEEGSESVIMSGDDYSDILKAIDVMVSRHGHESFWNGNARILGESSIRLGRRAVVTYEITPVLRYGNRRFLLGEEVQ